MFRALTCTSSGGNIVFTQHLVSSLSVNVCTVHWLRADSVLVAVSCSHDTATNTEGQLPEAVLIQSVSPDDERYMLETCREL